MSDAQLAGWLLIASAVGASLIGALMPNLNRRRVWLLPLDEYLAVVRDFEREWRWHAWLFAIGTVLMGLGLAFGAQAIPSRWAIASLIVYLLVAPLWLAVLAYRLDITVWAARDERGRATLDALGRWTGSLYNVFMVGGFFAIAMLGLALVDRPLVPAWTAWTLVVIGLVAGLSHWAARPNVMGMRSPFDLPVLIQLVPLFVAIPLAAGG
jgi:hypothetical protein